MLIRGFPQHLAAPTQIAADEIGGKAIHHEPRHRQLPAMQHRERAAVAYGALDVTGWRNPVVALLINEAEAQPDRIGKIDAGHPPRKGWPVVDAIRRKSERRLRESLPAPASERLGIAAPRRRIFGIELRAHGRERPGRQPGLQGKAPLAIDDEDVVPLLDARRL